MDPVTIGTAISLIFFTKALEKTGEKFAEATLAIVGKAIAKIREHSPETAKALEAGDKQVLNLGTAVLEQIPTDPIFAELVVVADAEENQEFQQKLREFKQARQIGLQDITAKELEAEIEQKMTANPTGVEQISATGVKVEGKATFKINQSINQ